MDSLLNIWMSDKASEKSGLARKPSRATFVAGIGKHALWFSRACEAKYGRHGSGGGVGVGMLAAIGKAHGREIRSS
jgi:thiamine pyrophosphate-dependent acetolactate synthase large subunit-like protein